MAGAAVLAWGRGGEGLVLAEGVVAGRGWSWPVGSRAGEPAVLAGEVVAGRGWSWSTGAWRGAVGLWLTGEGAPGLG
ncbi:hypothetical protein AQJ11_01170 [Streptomyces corchorusii]|uniref:Uncharacterized protein n=1 Tax=Streptomyces corchorusii TaxID=1903 RepID=A0A101QLZ4_STRCK|nr:hypothetical protein AQJ11_01170 [Streptomyces corchorusii]